jgi:glycosyltransferase involved in cell wall biosynthesis
MKHFFSVIIPTLNEEKYLPKLLSDLDKQKQRDFEVIIIDGGSVDRTVGLAKSFTKKLPIKLFVSRKRNVSFQRNLGAKKSRGKYLVFLDADTRINNTFLSKLFSVLTQQKILLLLPRILPDENEKNNPQLKLLFEIVNFLVEKSHLTNKPFSSGGNLIIERNLFLFLDGFDENLFIAEDHNLIKRAKIAGVTPKMFPSISVKFNLRRMRREGRLKFLYKNILATFHILLKGDIKKKIFDYQMGGEDKKKTSSPSLSLVDIKKYLEMLKKFINRF